MKCGDPPCVGSVENKDRRPKTLLENEEPSRKWRPFGKTKIASFCLSVYWMMWSHTLNGEGENRFIKFSAKYRRICCPISSQKNLPPFFSSDFLVVVTESFCEESGQFSYKLMGFCGQKIKVKLSQKAASKDSRQRVLLKRVIFWRKKFIFSLHTKRGAHKQRALMIANSLKKSSWFFERL